MFKNFSLRYGPGVDLCSWILMDEHGTTEVSSTPGFCFEERFLVLFSFQKDGWLCDIKIVCDDEDLHAQCRPGVNSEFKVSFRTFVLHLMRKI